jgi:hypothetical protein
MTIRWYAIAHRSLTVIVTMGLVLGPLFSPAPARAQSPGEEIGHGSIRGMLHQADEKTPIAGAKVTAVSVRTGKQYASDATPKDGSYLVDGLPAGSYDLVIEFGGNLFVVDNVLDLMPNESATHSYAVQPQRPANRSIANMPAPKGSATPIGETTPAAGFWSSTAGVVLLSVLGAGVVAALLNTGKNNASPSAP